MDKSEISKKIKQYGYTYVIRYKYHEDGFTNNYYYCTDNFGGSSEDIDEIKEELSIEEGDEFEIIDEFANDFNIDDYLSDKVIWFLNGSSEIDDKEYAKYSVAYIHKLYEDCYYIKEESDEYIRNVLTSVLKYLDLRKRNPMTIFVANEILSIFNIQRDEDLNVRKQIELIISPQNNDDVLRQLTTSDNIKYFRIHLERIGKAYKISEEQSQYRIGILFLRLFDALSQKKYILPTYINENGSIRNYTKFMRLLASYYGIEPPTYREKVLKTYKEKGMKDTLYSTIKIEHNDVWLNFY